MSLKKHLPGETIDPSLHPTRKVESMTSLAAELLLQEIDGRFDEPSGKRLRSPREPALHPSTPPRPPLASAPPPAPRTGRGRIALLVAGALILVLLSVTATLLLSR